MADGQWDDRILRHLLPDSLRKTFADKYPLGSQEDLPTSEKKIVAKFFFPAGRYTYYVVEGEPEGSDFIFFGYCLSFLGEEYDEWGYVSLSEWLSLRKGPFHMERDIHFPVAKRTIAEVCPKADLSSVTA